MEYQEYDEDCHILLTNAGCELRVFKEADNLGYEDWAMEWVVEKDKSFKDDDETLDIALQVIENARHSLECRQP